VEGVVIDTNVFVAAGFNSKSAAARVFEGVREGRFRLIWNEPTRRETEIVAWPAADPSQATGRVKRHDNQLHRARVLQVRIQSPPADSLVSRRNSPVTVERPRFSASVAGLSSQRGRQRRA
jgi:predicted nucleic acid-binding protein